MLRTRHGASPTIDPFRRLWHSILVSGPVCPQGAGAWRPPPNGERTLLLLPRAPRTTVTPLPARRTKTAEPLEMPPASTLALAQGPDPPTRTGTCTGDK